MRDIVIGDIHGCLKELIKLINKINLKIDDNIIFVGDLVDKGPDSAGVVYYVRKLSEEYNVVVVEGNHEDKHKRWRKHIDNNRNETANKMKGSEEISQIQSELSSYDLEFMNTFVPFHRFKNYLVVHGGIPGDMKEFPETPEDLSKLNSKKRKKFKLTTMCRFINRETGRFLALGTETENDVYWAENYDGRFGHVIFGHEPFKNTSFYPKATGIDTSCVFGGSLTAMIISENNSVEFETVDAYDRYAEPLVMND